MSAIDPDHVANESAQSELEVMGDLPGEFKRRAEKLNAQTPDSSSREAWTDEKIREAFIYDGGESEYHDPINGAREQARIAGAIFDRWLAEHDRQVLDRYADSKYGEVSTARVMGDDELSIRESAGTWPRHASAIAHPEMEPK